MRYLVVGIALLLSHASCFAATTLVDSLPEDLAARMERSAGGAEFLTDPPDGFPAFDYPAEVVVLGTIDEETVATVVLGELGPDAQARLAQALRDAGWQVISEATPRTIGFIGAPQRERPDLYCHELEPGRLNVDRIANEGERFLLLGLAADRAFTSGASDQASCREQVARGQRRAQLRQAESQMPRLELPGLGDPATAPTMHSSSSGRAANSEAASAQITSMSSLTELSAHLAGQLEAQGWIAGGAVESPYQTTTTWTRSLDDGALLLGVLSVVFTADDGFDLQFRLVRSAATQR